MNSRINLVLFLALAALLTGAVTSCEKNAKTDPAKLEVPEPFLVTAGIDNATFLWESVQHADAYELIVNDGEPLKVKGVSITFNDLKASAAYSLKMKALAPEGSEEWLDSDYCAPVSFTTAGKKALSAPYLTVTDVAAGGFTVSWNEVKRAGKYVYKINDSAEMQTTETSFTADGLTHSTQYTVRVKALPGEAYLETALESDWADLTVTTASPTTLDAPTLASRDIHTNGFTIAWAAVKNAGQYGYKIDGGSEQKTSQLSIAVDGLTALTTHKVEVRALPSEANADNYFASSWSSVEVKTLDLVALAAPQLKATEILGLEFTVSWPAVDHADHYMCSIDDGEWVAVSSTFVRYEGLKALTTYHVKVYAVPSEADRITYKDGPAASLSVTTKDAPSEDDKGGDLSDFDEKPIF